MGKKLARRKHSLSAYQKRKEAEAHNARYEKSKLPPPPKTEAQIAKEKAGRHRARMMISMMGGMSGGVPRW